MQQLIDRARDDFEKVLEVLEADFMTVKTGRAKPGMVEEVGVEAYEGQPKMMLKELASISSPDPHQLIIRPWDQSVIEAVEKALAASGLNLSPVVDGEMIRISVPALTEESRKDLVKLVRQKMESGRVLLRQARRKTKEDIDAREGEADVSEDDLRKAVEDLNKTTDEFMKKMDEMGKAKKAELMRI